MRIARNAGCLLIAAFTLLAAWMAPSANGAETATNQPQRPWMNRSLPPEQRASLLIREMTLDEKIAMLHGIGMPTHGYVGMVFANPRLGIPALRMADGRAGVGNHAVDVTLLPAPIAAASSWDVGLIQEFGKVLGEEQWKKGTNVALAPTIDVVRVPEWGRTFESFGEDPYFNARMAAAEIQGIQSQGPIADANMYLTMHQESNRLTTADSIVDERTLQEVYLPPFEAAIREGQVGTVMCALVRTNGVYSCENPHLLEEILRKQLGFDGWVMSDWTATHSTVEAANAGLDQEMEKGLFFGAPLKTAVSNGQVSMGVLDKHVQRILVPMFRQGLFDKTQTGDWSANVRSPQHDALARSVAEQGTVLLKNSGELLPLAAKASVAVIGEAGGKAPKISGGGSSAMIPPYAVSPLDGIRKRAGARAKVSYADGADIAAAVDAARQAEVAIVFVHTDETEGNDRPNLSLPGNQDQLIASVAGANRKTIVVLNTGGVVLMPWIGEVAGVVEAWYPGQEDGNAIAALLYGDVNPSAKLPLSFPRTASSKATASEEQWPGINGKSIYSEKLNVGYRWYDATNTDPLFPFGFGLSYTTFRLSNLAVAPASGTGHGEVMATVSVTNTGKRAGAEVVQAYVAHPAANGEPPHLLRAFAKVRLNPGETKQASLVLDGRSFSIYDVATGGWTTPAGTYEVLVGTSSRDLPLHRSIAVASDGSVRIP